MVPLFEKDFIAPTATGFAAGTWDRSFLVPYAVGTHVVTGVIIESQSCPDKAGNELRIEVKKRTRVWLPLKPGEEPIARKHRQEVSGICQCPSLGLFDEGWS
jgi:hypothetical protein